MAEDVYVQQTSALLGEFPEGLASASSPRDNATVLVTCCGVNWKVTSRENLSVSSILDIVAKKYAASEHLGSSITLRRILKAQLVVGQRIVHVLQPGQRLSDEPLRALLGADEASLINLRLNFVVHDDMVLRYFILCMDQLVTEVGIGLMGSRASADDRHGLTARAFNHAAQAYIVYRVGVDSESESASLLDSDHLDLHDVLPSLLHSSQHVIVSGLCHTLRQCALTRPMRAMQIYFLEERQGAEGHHRVYHGEQERTQLASTRPPPSAPAPKYSNPIDPTEVCPRLVRCSQESELCRLIFPDASRIMQQYHLDPLMPPATAAEVEEVEPMQIEDSPAIPTDSNSHASGSGGDARLSDKDDDSVENMPHSSSSDEVNELFFHPSEPCPSLSASTSPPAWTIALPLSFHHIPRIQHQFAAQWRQWTPQHHYAQNLYDLGKNPPEIQHRHGGSDLTPPLAYASHSPRLAFDGMALSGIMGGRVHNPGPVELNGREAQQPEEEGESLYERVARVFACSESNSIVTMRCTRSAPMDGKPGMAYDLAENAGVFHENLRLLEALVYYGVDAAPRRDRKTVTVRITDSGRGEPHTHASLHVELRDSEDFLPLDHLQRLTQRKQAVRMELIDRLSDGKPVFCFRNLATETLPMTPEAPVASPFVRGCFLHHPQGCQCIKHSVVPCLCIAYFFQREERIDEYLHVLHEAGLLPRERTPFSLELFLVTINAVFYMASKVLAPGASDGVQRDLANAVTLMKFALMFTRESFLPHFQSDPKAKDGHNAVLRLRHSLLRVRNLFAFLLEWSSLYVQRNLSVASKRPMVTQAYILGSYIAQWPARMYLTVDKAERAADSAGRPVNGELMEMVALISFGLYQRLWELFNWVKQDEIKQDNEEPAFPQNVYASYRNAMRVVFRAGCLVRDAK
eukprot:gnl/Trimastix_PCT/3223.p1 GENE.gnl/Trimastix_PCT/3223~~gnl/Trimastix_PCT/3223.p1  ORF type:complete len:916 (-),score=86.62 gnl/Trimastix_PCT/3223:275-3022(-)